MIARIFILLILVIVLPFLYIDYGMMKERWRGSKWKHVLLWLPCIGMLVYTLLLAQLRSFAPIETWQLFLYLLLLGVFIVPAAMFALCSLIGAWCKRKGWTSRNNGRRVGVVLGVMCLLLVIYGAFFGGKGVNVRRVDYYSAQVPPAFDGYRVALFSDAHVGSYIWGSIGQLDIVVDSLNAQHANIIAFTGDLQNMHPDELLPAIPIMKRLNAADGVFSVLGNHDYGDYLRADSATTKHNHQLMLGRQEEMGWHLLLDENFTVRRGGDSIFIAGMHNDGKVPIPIKGDPDKAMAGVPQGAFTIMLEHDPASWQRTVLPRTTAQLTLSGHTHGGQVNIAGVSPAAITCNEYDGMYEDASGRALFVTTGISGFVPFRIGLKPEVVVITLHRKN